MAHVGVRPARRRQGVSIDHAARYYSRRRPTGSGGEEIHAVKCRLPNSFLLLLSDIRRSGPQGSFCLRLFLFQEASF
jgi:hypothetical protein